MLQVLVLERVEPDANIHRYYVLAVEPTLFGDVGLRREWGRIGNRGGGCRLELHEDHDAAKEALGTWLRRKQGRGIRGSHDNANGGFAPKSRIRGVDDNARKQPFQRRRRSPLGAPFRNRAIRGGSERFPRRDRNDRMARASVAVADN